LGGGGAFGGGDLAVDVGLISVAGRTVASPGLAETLEACPLARFGGAFAFVGLALPLVGLALPLVGDAVAPVRDAVPPIGHPLARVGARFTVCQLALAPFELALGRVLFLGCVGVRTVGDESKCSTLRAGARGPVASPFRGRGTISSRARAEGIESTA
jgi:hypothetical protein